MTSRRHRCPDRKAHTRSITGIPAGPSEVSNRPGAQPCRKQICAADGQDPPTRAAAQCGPRGQRDASQSPWRRLGIRKERHDCPQIPWAMRGPDRDQPAILLRAGGPLTGPDHERNRGSKRFGEPLAPAGFRPPYVRNHCYAGAHSGTP